MYKRLTAATPLGTFTRETGIDFKFIVVYSASDVMSQAEQQRRLREKEGLCFGWYRTEVIAAGQARIAADQGMQNVMVCPVTAARPRRPRVREVAGIKFVTR